MMNKSEKILKLSQDGANAKDIAKKIGCHQSYVYIVLSRHRAQNSQEPQNISVEMPQGKKFWINTVDQLISDVEMELAKKEQEARELSHFLSRLKERVDAASV